MLVFIVACSVYHQISIGHIVRLVDPIILMHTANRDTISALSDCLTDPRLNVRVLARGLTTRRLARSRLEIGLV